MFASLLPSLRTASTGLRLLLIMTVLLGVLYPAAILGVGALAPARAAGSPVLVDGHPVGSSLIGQEFRGAEWFHGRPSAADYDALASGPSNLAARSPELARLMAERRAAVAAENGVDPTRVPADAVTASASGLDPDISPAYARIQVGRVAHERGLPRAAVQRLVEDSVQAPALGFLGTPRINVLTLNISLDALQH
ncbi:potassium-transporting ATPase subunit KdpC [Mycetocola spongiae]|uniref:potassium-transporting ATPase subunit KdpC n=1 Tax=Mycetocola spongiae TaxID=2859226 RepID=UPI001CF1A643|nr:potassium-transporting ATPase subunit KdpC [Mycetocola spongiae]UCR89406.1 potassium-transporting ATPase subunit KdpC [Mycetocola spongiae]